MSPLLEVQDLRVTFPSPQGPLEVVKGVSFTLGRERLGIVGESGSEGHQDLRNKCLRHPAHIHIYGHRHP